MTTCFIVHAKIDCQAKSWVHYTSQEGKKKDKWEHLRQASYLCTTKFSSMCLRIGAKYTIIIMPNTYIMKEMIKLPEADY